MNNPKDVIIKKVCHCRKSLSGIYNACCCKNHVMLNSFQHLHLTQTCDKKEEILNQVQDDNSIKEEALNKDSFRAPLRSGFTLRPSSSRSVSMRDIGAAPRGFTARSVTPQCWYAGYSGRTGFTLIELLVVVLIIGILVAVALPQYQKTVWKARYVQAKTAGSALAEAMGIYYLENGNYPVLLEFLDVSLSFLSSSVSSTDKSDCSASSATCCYQMPWGRCYLRKRGQVDCEIDKGGEAFLRYSIYLNYNTTRWHGKYCVAMEKSNGGIAPTSSDLNYQICVQDTHNSTPSSSWPQHPSFLYLN